MVVFDPDAFPFGRPRFFVCGASGSSAHWVWDTTSEGASVGESGWVAMGAGGSALRTFGGIDQRRTVEPMAELRNGCMIF